MWTSGQVCSSSVKRLTSILPTTTKTAPVRVLSFSVSLPPSLHPLMFVALLLLLLLPLRRAMRLGRVGDVGEGEEGGGGGSRLITQQPAPLPGTPALSFHSADPCTRGLCGLSSLPPICVNTSSIPLLSLRHPRSHRPPHLLAFFAVKMLLPLEVVTTLKLPCLVLPPPPSSWCCWPPSPSLWWRGHALPQTTNK